MGPHISFEGVDPIDRTDSINAALNVNAAILRQIQAEKGFSSYMLWSADKFFWLTSTGSFLFAVPLDS